MNYRRNIVAGLLSITLAFGGLFVSTTSVSAAVTPPEIWLTGNCGSFPPVIRDAPSGSFVASISYRSTSELLTITNSCSPTETVTVTFLVGSTELGSSTLGNAPPTLNYRLGRTDLTALRFTSSAGSTTLTLTYAGSGGGGGGGSSSSALVPQTFELSFTPSDGTTCTNLSQEGTSGAWISLPAAGDCTPPATKSNAKLLGWATSPDFPVAIAKRQVDNRWGAYETFNNDGQLTSVFIPAGGSTLVSAAGNLFAIWSV